MRARSYNRPSDITLSLIGDGAAWLSDDAGAALFNGRPASISRIQWLTGDQTTGSELILRAPRVRPRSQDDRCSGR